MNTNKQKPSKKLLIASILLWTFIFVDNTGLAERTKIDQLEIKDKYYVETKTIESNNSTTTIIPEHYRFVFEIRNKEVEMRYYSPDHNTYNIGDKVTVEYKIPINILKKPYITSYDFN